MVLKIFNCNTAKNNNSNKINTNNYRALKTLYFY